MSTLYHLSLVLYAYSLKSGLFTLPTKILVWGFMQD